MFLFVIIHDFTKCENTTNEHIVINCLLVKLLINLQIVNKPWNMTPDTNVGDLTKLCNHKRKLLLSIATGNSNNNVTTSNQPTNTAARATKQQPLIATAVAMPQGLVRDNPTSGTIPTTANIVTSSVDSNGCSKLKKGKCSTQNFFNCTTTAVFYFFRSSVSLHIKLFIDF